MPIIIKDYKWKQTINYIVVEITLKGVCKQNIDIFTSKRYIKIKYQQYFFEAILLHCIDVINSQCKITDSKIIFELRKNDDKIWDSLEPNMSKKEKMELKKQLLDEEYLCIQEQEKEKANKKSELKRVAIREQIELDTKQREQIEEIKKQETSNTLGDINKWSAAIAANPETMSAKKKNNPYKINTCSKQKRINVSSKVIKAQDVIPLPRAVMSLEIDFTSREFPTPSRESKLDEENEWLKQQAEARRSVGFVSEDIRPEEKNPQFLKAKGDEFLKNKNYLGAISAYSFGIKIAPKFVDLHIARSEAHLSVGNFNKAIQDCSSALNLLKPEVPVNLKERALCIGRRGEALCKIGFTKQGAEEIRISLKLVPSEYFTNVIETINNNSV